jgi:DNA-binding NtrC family response regulator
MPRLALIVDPDSHFLPLLGRVAEQAGWTLVERTTFVSARQELETRHPGAVVTNIRLGMFNGIHLAYLAKLTVPSARTIVYAEVDDPVLAVEAQRANAFYERRESLVYSLSSYLQSDLPAEDRRNVWNVDRRQLFRGGRRITDQAALRPDRHPM